MSWGTAETDRRLQSVIRMGTVTAVDPAAARCKVTLGGETETAWLPFPSPRSGAIQVWAPPTVGEQVVVAAPGGDTSQGLVIASLASDQFPWPSSDGGAFVVEIGGSRLEMTTDRIALSSNGSTLTMDASGIALNGARIDLN